MTYDPNSAKLIFLQAMELPTAVERAAFLDQACAGQPSLKARVEELIRTAGQNDSLLDNPAGKASATQIATDMASHPDIALTFLKPNDIPGSLGSLGNYSVLEVIGRGGMGIVFRAMDSKLNRVVAIKVLAPGFAGNAQARKRFAREAQAAAAVSHDHVVTIHAVDDGEKVPFIVMECIVGQSLQQKLDKVGALGLKEILRIGTQIASGLAAAHKQGLVHRDIKPANILLENGIERVKITDFGLARATDDVGITQSGQITGTPQYMSPEQAMGQPVDPRSDLFSLGSVLYTMCTGRPAFRGDSTIAVLRRLCDDSPRPIGEMNAEIPEWLIEIIDRLMRKKPEDRIQTAAEVAELLNQHLAHLQQPISVPRPARLPAARSELSSRRTRQRSLTAVTIVVLTLLASVGMIAYLATAQKRFPESNPLPVEIAGSAPTVTVKASETPAANASNLQDSSAKPSVVAEAEPVPEIESPAVAPFDAGHARAYQAGWATRLNIPVETTNQIGMKLRLIPPGKFQMGSTPEELAQLARELQERGASDFDKFVAQSSGPKHTVEISQPFYMGMYEVTIAQFQQFADETDYVPSAERAGNARFTWKSFIPDTDRNRQPVCGVSWVDADAFCQWLSRKESTESEQQAYALPSEAQWEYACRAGSETLWSCGDAAQLVEHAIVEQAGQPYPAGVGLRRANPFGLLDMHGNVDEWCIDWHNNSYYARSPLIDPVYVDPPKEGGSGRVARGGAWNAATWWSRSSTRAYDFPVTPTFPKGFRITCKVKSPAQ